MDLLSEDPVDPLDLSDEYLDHRLWAIVDAEGQLRDVVEGEPDHALEVAALFGEPVLDAYSTRAFEPTAMAANPRRLPTIPQSPGASQREAGLPTVSMRELLRAFPLEDNGSPYGVGLERAHAEILPVFPPRKLLSGHRWQDVKVWQDPMTTIEPGAFLGQNRKLEKPIKGPDGRRERRISVGLSLAPARMAFRAGGLGEGSLCLWSTPQCRSMCLVFSGHNMVSPYNLGVKLAKTRALLEHPVAFCRVLLAAVHRFACGEACRGWHPYVRLNVYSDIVWERVFPGLFEFFPNVSFYDYTKVPGRKTPPNYDLTFSYAGTNLRHVEHELGRGRRVAVVFLSGNGLPTRFLGLPVIDGTTHDFRPLDPAPCIVGLRWRMPFGRTRKQATSTKGFSVFVVPCFEVNGQIVAAETPRSTEVPGGVND
jgi:hypothetical protein